MANKLICYPFDENGNLCSYAYHNLSDEQRERVYAGETVVTGRETWKPSETKALHLTYTRHTRGRSAVTFYWKDENGHLYPMFLNDFDDLFRHGVVGSTVSGIFTYTKRGQNYGIKYVMPIPSDDN